MYSLCGAYLQEIFEKDINILKREIVMLLDKVDLPSNPKLKRHGKICNNIVYLSFGCEHLTIIMNDFNPNLQIQEPVLLVSNTNYGIG